VRTRAPYRAIFAVAAAVALTTLARGDEPPTGIPPPSDALSPLVAQALVPLLAEWIVQSRDAALANGVEPVPADVRKALVGYVPMDVLDRVRWQVGGAGETTLQENLFRFGYAPAVTLDYVVVFQNAVDASDPKLWVHELRHVMQFSEWGVPGFATRYLQDYEAVEKEAADYRWEWMKLEGLIPAPSVTDNEGC
jgi:hypothetical protein